MQPDVYKDDILRIKRVYEDRKRSIPPDRYSVFNLGNLCIEQEMQRALLALLRNQDGFSLESSRILEIGCGSGQWLRDLIGWGAEPRNVFGIDLLPERIAKARKLSPADITLLCGSAHEMPFESGEFGVVMQSMLFSSVIAPEMKAKIASEMLRVLQPGGFVIWYDFYVKNPRNPDVRGITQREMRLLFPKCRIECRRVTVAPPVARLIGNYSPWLYFVLAGMKLLSTHYLALIHKPGCCARG